MARQGEKKSVADLEQQPLVSTEQLRVAQRSSRRTSSYTLFHIALAYLAGLVSAGIYWSSFHSYSPALPFCYVDPSAAGRPGSTEIHNYPPPSPTNAFPSLFPSDVGYAGPTPTGAEPALVATAPSYPIHTGAPHLLSPETLKNVTKRKFDIFRHWGNLSPWFTVDRGVFGVDAGPEPPAGCRVTGLHLLHRHGARYPTGSASYGAPATLAAWLNGAEKWHATGQLKFLNDW